MVLESRKQMGKSRVLMSQSGFRFCWLKHPDWQLTFQIGRQRPERAGRFLFLDCWFLNFKAVLNLIPWTASQHQKFWVCSIIWWGLTWKVQGEFKSGSKNTLRIEVCISDYYCSGAISVVFFSARQQFKDSNQHLLLPNSNWTIISWILWHETWNTVGKS